MDANSLLAWGVLQSVLLAHTQALVQSQVLAPTCLCLKVVHMYVQASKLFDSANQTAAEAVASIRTVAAFSLQPQVSQLYKQQLVQPTRAIEKTSHTSGVGFGFSQFVIFAVYALGFW